MTAASELAIRIADAIIADFIDRRGLRQEWDMIAPEDQREIRDTWIEIIENELGGRSKGQ